MTLGKETGREVQSQPSSPAGKGYLPYAPRSREMVDRAPV